MMSATDRDLPPFDPSVQVLPGFYQHYKGGRYEVIEMARHSETLEPMVVYRALYGAHGLWVRPAQMFLEDVVVEGRLRPRFLRLENPTGDMS